MAINNVNGSGSNIPVDNQRLNQQQSAANQATNRGATETARLATPRQDSVSLTQSAQSLAQPQRRNAEAPVNQERVERLREAISNGEYRVNSERLASNIIRFESDLFGE